MLRRAVAEKGRLLCRAAAADCAAITQLRPAVVGTLLAAQAAIPSSTAPCHRAGFVSSAPSFAASDENTMVFYPEPEVKRQLAAGGMVGRGAISEGGCVNGRPFDPRRCTLPSAAALANESAAARCACRQRWAGRPQASACQV